jgi:hypothetical protein
MKYMLLQLVKNILRLPNIKFITFLVVVGFLDIPSTIAKTLSTYCITSAEPNSPSGEINLSMIVRGKTFVVVASGDSLRIKKNKDDEAFYSRVSVPQADSNIVSIDLGKSEWLWVDGRDIDYMVKINLTSDPPTFGSPIELPELVVEPCSYLSSFFQLCARSQGTYSIVLDRVFIYGHRLTFLGLPDFVSFEMIAGQLKQLPPKLHDAYYMADVPKLNGVLFKNNANEVLFYDGIKVISLLGSSSDWWEVSVPPPNERTILAFGIKARFLLELIKGPVLVPVSVPSKVLESRGVQSFFKMPNDPRLWIMNDYSIVTEVKGSLKPVVTAMERINPRKLNRHERLGIFPFTLTNPRDIDKNLALVSASPATKCIARLDDNKTVYLGNKK